MFLSLRCDSGKNNGAGKFYFSKLMGTLYKKNERKQKDFFVLDVETRGLKATPDAFIFGCVYGHNFKKTFFNVTDLRKWCISKRNKGKVIFAHNAEFDFSCIFGNIIVNLDRSAIFVGSTFICAKCNGVNFFNSLAILKSSVAALGKVSGIEKMELDNKFKDGDAVIEVTEDDIKYCFRDCEIVYDYLFRIFAITGRIKPTIASCAMEIFTTKFLKKKINIHPLNEKFRSSYYGGRVECFHIGKIEAIKIDVNSLYPFVCTNMFFPNFERLVHKKNISTAKFMTILKAMEGQAEIRVEHIDSHVGGLPFKRDSEIIYPCGNFVGCWNFNEIRMALKHGLIKIRHVFNVTYGTRIAFSSLSDYMKHYYKLKDETNGAEKLIYKFLLNALTGKFAEKEHEEQIYYPTYAEFLEDEWKYQNKDYHLYPFGKDRDDLFVGFTRKGIEKSWLIPTVSSYITSEARCYMLPFYLKYKKFLCYTDTDSIAMTCKPDKAMLHENKLGKFKIEKDIIKHIHGNKHYLTEFNGEKFLYLKGVPKKHTVNKKTGAFEYLKMTKTREAIRSGNEAGIFKMISKQLKKSYTKRIVTQSGKTKIIKL